MVGLSHETLQSNPERLPDEERTIASTVVFSSDGRILLGRKPPKGGGVYSESWHLPGGGKEAGESLPKAAFRELGEEVIGLPIVNEGNLEPMPWLQGKGAAPKTHDDGRRVWCEMEFNYFRYPSALTAKELAAVVQPGSDFVELRFFSPTEIAELPTVPGGIEQKIISGELTATSQPPN